MPIAPRGLVRKVKKHTSYSPQVEPDQSGLPRAIGFNGLFRTLPGEPGFFATITCEDHRLAGLISASGYQDHTASPSALAPFVFRHKNVHRIPPNVRDDGQRPSFRARCGISNAVSSKPRSEIFFAEGLDIDRKSPGMTCPGSGKSSRTSGCIFGIDRAEKPKPSWGAEIPIFGFRSRRLLQRQSLDGLGGVRGTAPPQEINLLIFQSIRCAEKLL